MAKNTRSQRPLLILDVDETLVYASEQPLPGRTPDFHVGQFAVYRRPHLSAFLGTVSGAFEIAVWSSGSPDYVSAVVAGLFPDRSRLRFAWACDRCTLRYDPELQERFYLKNLKKVRRLGYPLEQILVIDDSPEKLSQNYGNHIRVLPFRGNPADDELLRLAAFVARLAESTNFRLIEKRNWRQRVNQV